MKEETPEQAWNALMSMPKETAISLLNYDSTWQAILPHLTPDTSIRSVFEDKFFDESSAKKRHDHIFGAVALRHKEAHRLIKLASLDEDQTSSGFDTTAKWVGSSVIQAIRSKDPTLFTDLKSLVPHGTPQEHRSQSRARWVIFCKFVITNERLPTKNEVMRSWDHFGRVHIHNGKKKRTITHQQANRWRNDLGLDGLPC